ncbi:MAG: hypothetical protein ACI9CP_001683 [Cryomorphaceae bacterium]|jgi:hypothetical protein
MRTLINISFALISLTITAQNLVTNPSFEDYLECPFSTAALNNQVVDWFSWQETPDFFHECSNQLEGFAGVPNNAWGSQLAVLGAAYAGFGTYTFSDPEIREYMASPLSSPLTVGTDYYIMFFTSWYDGGLEIESLCATNHIGLRFFENPNYGQSNPFEADNFAHLDYSEVLTDSTNWTLVDGWFTADQAYDWVALGNFFDSTNTEIEIFNEEDRCFGFYYIENVCVATDPLFCEQLLSNGKALLKEEINVFPNPTSKYVTIKSTENVIHGVELASQLGKIVFQQENTPAREVSIDVSNFAKGLYVIKVYGDNYLFTTKLLIE